MKVKLLKGVLTVLSLICILCIPVTPIHAEPQGTDGTEMQVIEPEKLEIQLGADWAGVEFQLKTDSGLYPGTIAVGEDGVLRMELGGSKSYVLTCMNSSVSAPEATQAPATTEEAQNESNESQESDGSNSGQDTKGTVASPLDTAVRICSSPFETSPVLTPTTWASAEKQDSMISRFLCRKYASFNLLTSTSAAFKFPVISFFS